MKRLTFLPALLILIGCDPPPKPPQVKPAPKIRNADEIARDTANVVEAGLSRLARLQAEDGSFMSDRYPQSVAITSLACRAFLSAKRNDDRDKIVARAIRYVLSRESENRPGLLRTEEPSNTVMFDHGFAILLLADALGNLDDQVLKATAKEALERAVNLTIETQNHEGGWRYAPASRDADITVVAVQATALRAARDAGIPVPANTLARASAYTRRCQNDDGGFRYQDGFELGSAAPRSAAGVAALLRLEPRPLEGIDRGMRYLHKEVDPDRKREFPMMHYTYCQYFTALAMRTSGDEDWQRWFPSVRNQLLDSQREGSWSHAESFLGPTCDTAVALIILQMPEERLVSMKR